MLLSPVPLPLDPEPPTPSASVIMFASDALPMDCRVGMLPMEVRLKPLLLLALALLLVA